MKKENLENLIEIYENEGLWYVDYTGGVFVDIGDNLAYSEESRDKAILSALINLAIGRMEFEESEEELTDFLEEILGKCEILLKKTLESESKYNYAKAPRRE